MLNLSITKNNSCAVIPQAFPTRQDGEVKSLVCPWHYRGDHPETAATPTPLGKLPVHGVTRFVMVRGEKEKKSLAQDISSILTGSIQAMGQKSSTQDTCTYGVPTTSPSQLQPGVEMCPTPAQRSACSSRVNSIA